VTNVDLTAPGKLLVLGLVVLGCFSFIVASMFVTTPGDTTPAWATLTLVVGYLIGNGAGARKGIEQAPVFTPSKDEQPAA
jgi:hypothetical protein